MNNENNYVTNKKGELGNAIATALIDDLESKQEMLDSFIGTIAYLEQQNWSCIPHKVGNIIVYISDYKGEEHRQTWLNFYKHQATQLANEIPGTRKLVNKLKGRGF